MAGHLTLQLNRQPQKSWHALTDPVSSLSSSIIAGLGMFGLAANGTCLTELMQCEPPVQEKMPVVSDLPKDTSDREIYLMTRDGSRVETRRMPRCQY